MTDLTARRRACLASCVVGLLLALTIFFPGLMNVDAWNQLQEIRSGVYYDWHPPAMTRLWSLIDMLLPGPAGMLLLHNLLFWGGLGLTAYLSSRSPGAVALFVLLAGLYPPVFSALGAIWKDVGLGAALLLAFGLLLLADRSGSRAVWLAALPPLGYGLAVRHNALPAVLPLVLWAGFIVRRPRFPSERRSALLSVAFGLGLTLALLALSLVLNRAFTNGGQLFPIQQILLHDLTAISLQSGQVLVPEDRAEGASPLTLDQLRCLYRPDSASELFSGESNGCQARLRKITDEGRMGVLWRSWGAAVVAHPGAYLEHRAVAFRRQLALDFERVCYPLQARTDANNLGISIEPSWLTWAGMRLFAGFAYLTPLFRGWIYVATIALLLVGATRASGESRWAAIALGSSGLLYAAAYLFASTSCDYRLHWWTVVSAVVMVGLALKGRADERSTPRIESRGEPPSGRAEAV